MSWTGRDSWSECDYVKYKKHLKMDKRSVQRSRMTLWFRGTQSGQHAKKVHSAALTTATKQILRILNMLNTKMHRFSWTQVLQSSLESSVLSMSTSSHEFFVRCSKLLASAITLGDKSTTQAAMPETRSLNSVSFSHSSVSVLYTWTYFILSPLSWERPPRT